MPDENSNFVNFITEFRTKNGLLELQSSVPKKYYSNSIFKDKF